MEKPNYKPFIITILIMTLIIAGLVTFIVLDKKEQNKEKINEKTVINNVNININNFYKVAETLRKFDNAFNDPNSSYFGYIYSNSSYSNGRLLVSKFDLGAAIFMIMRDEMIENNTLQTVKESTIKKELTKLLGKQKKYERTNVTTNDYYKIAYDEEKNAYAYITTIPTIKHSNGYVSINSNSRLLDEYIVVTRKVFYVEYENSNAIIYKDASKKEKIGEISMTSEIINNDEILGKFSSKLNTYDYYFIKNSDTDYTFEKIVKTR